MSLAVHRPVRRTLALVMVFLIGQSLTLVPGVCAAQSSHTSTEPAPPSEAQEADHAGHAETTMQTRSDPHWAPHGAHAGAGPAVTAAFTGLEGSHSGHGSGGRSCDMKGHCTVGPPGLGAPTPTWFATRPVSTVPDSGRRVLSADLQRHLPPPRA